MKKSILFVIYQTGVKGNGGVQSITNIIKELAPHHNIYVLTQLETGFNEIWKNAGANVFYKAEKGNRLLNLIHRNIYVFFLLKKIAVKTVHCNDIQSLMAVFLGVKLSFKKLIFNKRAVKPEKEHYPRSWNIVLSFVDHVIVLSQDMKQRVVKHFPVLKNKISYSYSIVDFEKFKPLDKPGLRERLQIPKDKIVFGIVGRFEEVKQQDLFIKECVAQLSQEVKQQVVFYLIGDFDPLTNLYARKCRDLVLENNLEAVVKLLPYQERVEEWYNVFDYSLVVSRREGLARCMIESLSSGVPVISFDVSSAREILEKFGFKVINQNDYDSLVESITRISNHEEKLGENFTPFEIHENAKSIFSKQAVCDSYESVY